VDSILKVRVKDDQIIDIPALKGRDGKTPVKGQDYFTEADKTEFVKAVLDALPKAEEDEF
jgi:hypothetical protein